MHISYAPILIILEFKMDAVRKDAPPRVMVIVMQNWIVYKLIVKINKITNLTVAKLYDF